MKHEMQLKRVIKKNFRRKKGQSFLEACFISSLHKFDAGTDLTS